MKSSFLFALLLVASVVASTSLRGTFKRRVDEEGARQRAVERKSRSNDAGLTGGMPEAQYFMDITIGGQPFTMTMDTGSSMMAVVTQDCLFQENEKTPQQPCDHKHTPYSPDDSNYKQPDCFALKCDAPFNPDNLTEWSCYQHKYCIGILAYGDGTIAGGPVEQDSATITTSSGPLTTDSQQFITIKMEETSGLSTKDSDGIIGLAYPSLSYDVPTIVDNLFKSKAILHDQFSMCMGDWEGQIVWGDDDPDLYDGELVYIPIIEESYYVINPPVISIGGKPLKAQLTGQTIVDSGTTLTVVSKAVLDALITALDKPCTGATPPFYCNNPGFFKGDIALCGITSDQFHAVPNITFEWGNVSVSIGGEAYIRHFYDEGSVCTAFGFFASDDDDLGNILGDTFMKNFYTVFDRENKRIGLAPSKNCGETIFDHQSTSDEDSSDGESDSGSGCKAHTSCKECAKKSSCVWCQGDSECVDGNFYGADSGCKSDWRWMQCKVNGKWIFVAELSFVGLILLCIICCCIKCMCCQKKKKTTDRGLQRFDSFRDEERGLISNHPKTDQRRAEMRAKYGLRD